MKQYCRYCSEATESFDYENVVWCEAHRKEMTHATAKTENHCKDFRFCEIDVFNPEHRYRPVQKKEKIDYGQKELFEVAE